MKIEFTKTPCAEATEWLKKQPDIRAAWSSCERGDWMWWALRHIPGALPDKKTSVKFARWCAKRAREQVAASAAAFATYAADGTDASCADAADVAYANAAASDADAVASAAGAAAFNVERKAQADWVRKHVPCPKHQTNS